ncbi:MAG: hypothetical protein ABSH06_21225 [Thermodesulfobacteriota bacterium]|jgi:hypothetical protein
MAEQRLSKLQKWILMVLYLIDPKACITVKDLKRTSIYGLRIWGKDDTLESPWGKGKRKRASMDVSFSRTLRSLEMKNLLFRQGSSGGLGNLSARSRDMIEALNPGLIEGGYRGCNIFDCLANTKEIYLTGEGEAKAKELLNVKNAEVNNKELREVI